MNNIRLFLIAGPCVIESYDIARDIALSLKEITDELDIPFWFKASFDKANRTSIHGYRGPGLKKGLDILKKIKDELDIQITTDIHEPYQADEVSKVADMIQIPAFLCRQTDLLIAAAKTNKIINIKKGQFLAPWDMKNVVEKVTNWGNKNIMVCERGNSFGYNNLIVDMTSIIELGKLGFPVVFDATHSVQKPGGMGNATGGNREYAPDLAKAAIAAGADGIFMEVHPDPDHAKSDGPNMLKLSDIKKNLIIFKKVFNSVRENQKGNLVMCQDKI